MFPEVRTASIITAKKKMVEIRQSVGQGRILAGSIGKGVVTSVSSVMGGGGHINSCTILGGHSITNIEKPWDRLMLFRELIIIYFQNQTKLINHSVCKIAEQVV